jgi:D-arginine dehydrogenase
VESRRESFDTNSKIVGTVKAVVVGGGIAGVSIAYELATEAEVVLLEQESALAHHTTGRSAAMYLQSYGGLAVRALTVASRGNFDELQERFRTPELLLPKPLLWTADDEALHELRTLLATDAPLREVQPAEALRLCPALRPERLALAAEDTSAREIDVHAVHQAYVSGLRQRGGKIRSSQALTAARRDGGGWRVETTDGPISVDVVVNAAGAWADLVAESAGIRPVGLRPLRRTIFMSPFFWPEASDGWPFIGDAGERFYWKAEHGQILASPADETPDVPRDVRPEEEDIARAMETINEHTRLGLRSVRSAWAGLRTFPADRGPVVGPWPGEPGFFWFAGQGGYGIQMAPALARVGAGLILGERLPADVAALGISPEQLAPDRPSLADGGLRHG